MQLPDQLNALNRQHKEVLNDILTVQTFSMNMATFGTKLPLQIHMKDVDEFTLDYLSAYFAVKIVPYCSVHDTQPYISIKSQCCTIIVQLKKQKNESK